MPRVEERVHIRSTNFSSSSSRRRRLRAEATHSSIWQMRGADALCHPWMRSGLAQAKGWS